MKRQEDKDVVSFYLSIEDFDKIKNWVTMKCDSTMSKLVDGFLKEYYEQHKQEIEDFNTKFEEIKK